MTTGPDPFSFQSPPYGDPSSPSYQPVVDPYTPAPSPFVHGNGAANDGLFAGDPSVVIGEPPILTLVAALLVGAAAAVVAALWGHAAPVALAAWTAAGPVGVGFLALYSRQDTRRRTLPVYNAAGWTPLLYWAAVSAIGVGIVISAVRIAEWAGRL